jgi:hypothetical protein
VSGRSSLSAPLKAELTIESELSVFVPADLCHCCGQLISLIASGSKEGARKERPNIFVYASLELQLHAGFLMGD